jgi:hypothetical protein
MTERSQETSERKIGRGRRLFGAEEYTNKKNNTDCQPKVCKTFEIV